MITKRLTALGTALLLFCAACGTSGDGQQERPIEALYYVSGAVGGTQFGFVETADPANCGSPGTGIQSKNSNHQFGDRVFTTPHLFVLENNRQPIRAVFRNLDTVPITVDFYLGQTPQASNIVIQPGECQTVATPGGETVVPQTSGPKVQVEICSPDNPIDLRTSCLETAGDRNISFFATIGDIRATNITNCLLPPILDACRTPATMFLESPQDQVDAIMSVNPGQNPGGQPTAQVRLEMYLNGNFKEFMAGTNPVVSADL